MYFYLRFLMIDKVLVYFLFLLKILELPQIRTFCTLFFGCSAK